MEVFAGKDIRQSGAERRGRRYFIRASGVRSNRTRFKD
jgi:hypothetical protein